VCLHPLPLWLCPSYTQHTHTHTHLPCIHMWVIPTLLFPGSLSALFIYILLLGFVVLNTYILAHIATLPYSLPSSPHLPHTVSVTHTHMWLTFTHLHLPHCPLLHSHIVFRPFLLIHCSHTVPRTFAHTHTHYTYIYGSSLYTRRSYGYLAPRLPFG